MGRALTGQTRCGARACTRTVRSSMRRVASLILFDVFEHWSLTTPQPMGLHRDALALVVLPSILWRSPRESTQ